MLRSYIFNERHRTPVQNIELPALQTHIRDVLANVASNSKYLNEQDEREFKIINAFIHDNLFFELYKKEFEDFYCTYGRGTIGSVSMFQDTIKRIPAEYNNLEAFKNEILEIRNITNPSIALNYHNAVTTSLYAAPNSPFLAYLFVEIHILVNYLLCDFSAGKLNSELVNQQSLEKTRKEKEQEQVNSTEPEIRKIESKLLAWAAFKLYQQKYLAAHMRLVPQPPEVNKDDFHNYDRPGPIY